MLPTCAVRRFQRRNHFRSKKNRRHRRKPVGSDVTVQNTGVYITPPLTQRVIRNVFFIYTRKRVSRSFKGLTHPGGATTTYIYIYICVRGSCGNSKGRNAGKRAREQRRRRPRLQYRFLGLAHAAAATNTAAVHTVWGTPTPRSKTRYYYYTCRVFTTAVEDIHTFIAEV